MPPLRKNLKFIQVPMLMRMPVKYVQEKQRDSMVDVKEIGHQGDQVVQKDVDQDVALRDADQDVVLRDADQDVVLRDVDQDVVQRDADQDVVLRDVDQRERRV